MAKNKLSDLNDHLFAAMERLNSEDVNGDALKEEIERSRAMAGVAREIVNAGKLALDAQRKIAAGEVYSKPPLLEEKRPALLRTGPRIVS